MAQIARRKLKTAGTRLASQHATTRKLTKQKAAKALASLIEGHMSDQGFPEEDKNRRVASFAERVDRAIANRAKS